MSVNKGIKIPKTITVDYGEFKIKVKQLEIADCIVDWEGIEVGGKPFLYSKEMPSFLSTITPWLYEI